MLGSDVHSKIDGCAGTGYGLLGVKLNRNVNDDMNIFSCII